MAWEKEWHELNKSVVTAHYWSHKHKFGEEPNLLKHINSRPLSELLIWDKLQWQSISIYRSSTTVLNWWMSTMASRWIRVYSTQTISSWRWSKCGIASAPALNKWKWNQCLKKIYIIYLKRRRRVNGILGSQILSKSLMELIFNPLWWIRWSMEGPD